MSEPVNGYALVTGASRRIGRAIALDLAAYGYDVAVHYNGSEEDAAAVVTEITEAGGIAAPVSADLGNHDEVLALIHNAGEAVGGPITTLINNASLFEEDTVETVTAQSWNAHLSVNTLAPLLLTQALAASLGDQSGNVINIVDQRVWRLNPGFTSYTASKAALWALTQTTAQALAPRVRVNAIGPGPVLQSIHQTDHDFAAEASNVPLGKGPELTEICRAVRFLLETPSMTGQMIALDGGQHLAWQTPDFVE